jgi:vanillate O-demethylase ferredoxin subunit
MAMQAMEHAAGPAGTGLPTAMDGHTATAGLDDLAVVERISDLGPAIREFELRPQGRFRPWSPGSHLTVDVGEAGTRTYSLVGLPPRDSYRIAVKRLQPSRGGSRRMWSLVAGDRIAIGGPHNHFALPFDGTQFLLVAGGIGITPLLGMALTLAAKQADVTMCYAARSPQELVYLKPLREALGERLTTFSSLHGERIDFDAQIGALAPQAYLLCCGPLTLLRSAREAWSRAGRPSDRLRFETFGASGTRAPEPFWVEVAGYPGRIAVDAGTSMLDALTRAGIETVYDCLRGECGLCAVDILALEGEIDHRDVFLGDQQRRSGRRICTCVSRVAGGGVVIDTGFRSDE